MFEISDGYHIVRTIEIVIITQGLEMGEESRTVLQPATRGLEVLGLRKLNHP